MPTKEKQHVGVILYPIPLNHAQISKIANHAHGNTRFSCLIFYVPAFASTLIGTDNIDAGEIRAPWLTDRGKLVSILTRIVQICARMDTSANDECASSLTTTQSCEQLHPPAIRNKHSNQEFRQVMGKAEGQLALLTATFAEHRKFLRWGPQWNQQPNAALQLIGARRSPCEGLNLNLF